MAVLRITGTLKRAGTSQNADTPLVNGTAVVITAFAGYTFPAGSYTARRADGQLIQLNRSGDGTTLTLSGTTYTQDIDLNRIYEATALTKLYIEEGGLINSRVLNSFWEQSGDPIATTQDIAFGPISASDLDQKTFYIYENGYNGSKKPLTRASSTMLKFTPNRNIAEYWIKASDPITSTLRMFTITQVPATNGTYTAPATGGNTQVITVNTSPNPRYKATQLIVYRTSNPSIFVSTVNNGDGTFSFIHPAIAVTIEVVFEPTGVVNYDITHSSSGNGQTTTSVSSAATGTVVDINVSPNSGYELDTLLVEEVPSGNLLTITTVNEGSLYRFTMGESNVEVKSTFKEIIIPPDPEYNITVSTPIGGTITPNKTKAQESEVVLIDITTLSGYIFESIEVATSNSTVPLTTISPTQFSFEMPNENVIITGTWSEEPEPPTEHTVSYNGTSTKFTVNYTNNEQIVLSKPIILTANVGYYFPKNITITNAYSKNGTSTNLTIPSNDSRELTIEIQSDTDYVINMNQISNAMSESYEFTVGENFEIANATINYNPDDKLILGKPVIIKANPGYKFPTGVYKYTAFYDGVVWNGTEIEIPYHPTQMVIPITEGNIEVMLNSAFNAIADVPITTITESFAHIYKVNKEQLQELSRKVFGNIITWGTSSTSNPYDITQFIYKIYNLPLPIRPEQLSSGNRIIIGNKDSGIITDRITTDIYHQPLGSIYCPEVYNNVYDYLNTDVWLYVPYFEKVKIPYEYAIGQTLTIHLAINLYDSEATLTIHSSLHNEVFATYKNMIGFEIPISNKSNIRPEVYGQIGGNFYTPFNEAYVEIIRNKPFPPSQKEQHNGYSNVYDQVRNYVGEGYIRVSDVRIETNATEVEENEIRQIMSKGIYL